MASVFSAAGQNAPNKLKVFTNFLSYAVYDYLEECEAYDDANAVYLIEFTLKPRIYIKTILATTKKQPGQSIDDFLQVLKQLSKDCNYCAVSAEVYRQGMIRDDFINTVVFFLARSVNGSWRTNQQLSFNVAVRQVTSSNLAQKHAQGYENPVFTRQLHQAEGQLPIAPKNRMKQL